MFQPPYNLELVVEGWVLSAVCVTILLTRLAIRLRTVGLSGFQGDDYASLGSIAFVMMFAVSVNEASEKGQNLDVNEDDLPNLTDTDIARFEYGSKMQLVSWYSYSAFIWTLKVTILCFYKRLTSGSFQAKIVKYVSYGTALAYVVVLLVTTFGCYPYHKNWQVSPMAPWSCRYRPGILITVAILNATTSAGILCIPAPMLYQLRVPMRKKLVIALSLSSAVVVISAAILRASITFSVAPTAANLNAWGARETVLSTLAVNFPILRLISTRAFWTFGPYNPECHIQPYKRSSRGTSDAERGVALQAYKVGVRNSGDSRENIIGERHTGKDVVVVQTTLEIEHHDRDDILAQGENDHGQQTCYMGKPRSDTSCLHDARFHLGTRTFNHIG